MPRDDSLEDPRPAKKPRMMLPDGFQTSAANTPKPQSRLVEFSRFAGDETPQKAHTGNKASSSGVNTPRRPQFILPEQNASRTSKAKALRPPVIAEAPSAGPSTSSRMRMLKAPDLSSVLPARDSPKLRPITAAVPRPVPDVPSNDAAPAHRILAKTFVLPQRTGKPSSSHLKPLPPPPPLAPPKAGPSKPATKSILDTRVARALDIHSDSGAAERMALYLQQHGTGYVSPYDRELHRGVEQSPEKRSKAKNAKYLRGGLAEAASRALTALHTSHMLWEADLARMQKKGQAAKPAVHLRVHAVLSASPAPRAKGAHAPQLVLVRGAVVSADSLEVRRGPVTALFRIGDVHRAPGALRLAEGREVHAWRPWTHITKPEEEGGVVWCFSRYHVFEPKRRQPEPFPMVPSQ